MPKFSSNTILELLEAFRFFAHSDIEEFVIRFGLQEGDNHGTLDPRKLGLVRYLFDNPEKTGPFGSNVVFEIIEYLIERHELQDLSERFPRLARSLERNGYVVENGKLRALLPENLSMAETESGMIALLRNFRFDTAKGHFEQAIAAHTRGEWAAANSQLRPFIESLFDSIADTINNGSINLPQSSHERREWLAQFQPPFLLVSLNEWEIGGTRGFVQGFWNRLHPQGSHPGLSDEEDSTFRLHIVIITASHYLRRLVVYQEANP